MTPRGEYTYHFLDQSEYEIDHKNNNNGVVTDIGGENILAVPY